MFLNSEVDNQWPCENQEKIDAAEQYPYPYTIDNVWQWKKKGKQEVEDTFDNDHNVKYTIKNDHKITIKKQEIEFDPNKIHLFRVSLSQNEQNILQH